MKKLAFVFVAILLSLVAMPTAHSFAESNSNFDDTAATVINGTVTNGGTPVNHANVNVTCNGHTLATATDSHGSYTVSFSSGLCGLNNKVTVVASVGNLSGSNSGTVQGNSCNTDVTVINVSVPEFGLLTTISGSVISGGAFLAIRRRSQGENKA